MGSVRNHIGALIATSFVVVSVCASQSASAITADLAKKCRSMALKAHPSVRVGSKAGTAKAQQDYYRACVAKNGNME